MAEYLANASQLVSLNSPIVFSASIPCTKRCVYHEDDTGIFTLCGRTNNCFARYQVTLNLNASIPDGGAVTPIAVALVVEGEQRPTSKAIFEPSATGILGNLTSTAIVTVPQGCCFSLSAEYVDATTEDAATTPTPTIEVQNANLVVTRIS